MAADTSGDASSSPHGGTAVGVDEHRVERVRYGIADRHFGQHFDRRQVRAAHDDTVNALYTTRPNSSGSPTSRSAAPGRSPGSNSSSAPAVPNPGVKMHRATRAGRAFGDRHISRCRAPTGSPTSSTKLLTGKWFGRPRASAPAACARSANSASTSSGPGEGIARARMIDVGGASGQVGRHGRRLRAATRSPRRAVTDQRARSRLDSVVTQWVSLIAGGHKRPLLDDSAAERSMMS